MKSRNFSEKEKNECAQTYSQSVPIWQWEKHLWKSGDQKPSTETDFVTRLYKLETAEKKL